MATLRTSLAAVACTWLLPTAAMAQVTGMAPASGLGGRELGLLAAIALLLAGVSRLKALELPGPARSCVAAGELPPAGTELRTGRPVPHGRG